LTTSYLVSDELSDPAERLEITWRRPDRAVVSAAKPTTLHAYETSSFVKID